MPIRGVSDETGEVYDVVAERRRGRGPYFDYHIVSSARYREVASVLYGAEAKLFMLLPALMRDGNWIYETALELASVCRLSQSSISRALRSLEARGLVRRAGNALYRFTPHIAWRGRKEDFHRVIREWHDMERRARFAVVPSADSGESEDGL